uniref:Tudor domain containing 15 n=1 Tax=Scophthalmus maximus TaxID=52904 RepID=A0A8D3CPM4_SCOMX
MKITHIDWNSEATLIHFQGQYLTICDLDYNILQGEIQSTPKTKAAVDIGEFCLVEDLASARWYRGRVQNRKVDLFDIFLVDHGNILSVDIAHVSSCSNDLFILPAKIVCGFLANVLLLESCSHSVMEEYFSSLIGRNVTGYIQALLPHKILLLEAPDINNDLVRHGFGRHVDTHTFIFLVEMLTEVPLNQNIQPVPDLLIEKQRGHEFCFKPSGLQGYENILPRCRPVLSCGTCAKVRVTAAVNPRLFYCQMANMKTDLCEMSKKLAAVCEHRTKVCSQTTPENLGLLCSVKSKDGKWYRGFVQCLPINSHIRVLFIDYGFFESVKVENVHKLPPDLYSTPIVAFPCSLSCLGDQDETVRTQQLSLLKTGLLGGVLDMEISSFDEEQHLYTVTLVGAGDNNVKEPQPIIGLPRREEESVSEKEELPPKGGYFVATDIGGNTEQSEDKGREEDTCKNEIKVPQAPVSFKALCIKPGFEFAVNCINISSPTEFWCQPQGNVPALEELMDKIQQYYSTNTAPLQSGVACCVAKSPLDGRWHRAFIIEKQKNHARVMLIDYGFTVQIKEENLEAILQEYVHLEGQAFRCSLSNLIEPTDSKSCGSWSPELCNAMKKFVLDSNSGLRCKVVSQMNMRHKGLCNVVDLYNTRTQQSVTNRLMELGLAREATVATKQLPTVSPETFVYSSYDLSPGNEEQVYVTHVSSQRDVYCQLARNTEIIDQLEKKIFEESEKMTQASARAVVRKLCLAKYFDGKWYRGLAHPVQSPLHLSVFFVDYGNKSIPEKTNVAFIPRDAADLLHTPMQALRCCLASVPKEELYADVKEWLDKEILNKQVKAVVLGKSEDGSFDVALHAGDVNINEKVNELILSLSPKQKAAVTFSKGTRTKTPRALHMGTTETTVKCKRPAERKSLNRPTSNPCRGTQVRNALPKKREYTNTAHGEAQNQKPKDKPHNVNKTKGCSPVKPLGNTVQLDTNTKSERPQNTNIAEMHQLSCLPDKKVSVGLRTKCFTSHIDSVDRFFLQVSEDEPAILKMAEDLNLSVFRNSLKTATSLRINDLVLAVYEEDGALYRSLVKDHEGSACFVVEFIDYGNSAVVGKEKIYLMPKECLSQPRFSFSCCLSDTSAFENDASFTDAVTEKPLMVDFVSENIWMVEIVVNGLFLIRQMASLQRNKETITSNAETQNEEPISDTSLPQQLALAPIDIDKVNLGFAAAVTTPFEFCVVLEDLLLTMNRVSVLLDELPGRTSPLAEAHLVPGACCLFKSDSKNKWCRTEIVHVDTTVVLYLVDYGHYEGMPREDGPKLQRLPEALIELPRVTCPCILRGVKPVGEDGQWSDEAAVFFQRRLYRKHLQIFFRELVSNTHWKVDVLADGVHVAKELVDAGHADYIDVMLGLRYGSISVHVFFGSSFQSAVYFFIHNYFEIISMLTTRTATKDYFPYQLIC